MSDNERPGNDLDIKQRIRKPFKKRSDPAADIALLARIFKRTTNTVVPQPVPLDLADESQSASIALIARDVRLQREGDKDATAQIFSRYGILQGLRIHPKLVAATRISYLDDLAAAADAGASMVCFGEGAIPWEHEPDDVADRIRRCRIGTNGKLKISRPDAQIVEDVRRRNQAFLNSIQELANKKNILIVAGSAHDRDCNNVGRVFSPQGNKPHKKIQSALKLKEKLMPRSSPEFVIFETPRYYIIVLICIDAYSPETVLRCGLLAVTAADLAQQDKTSFWSRKPVRYIFVPSLNDKGSQYIYDASLELSQLCDTLVSYVNCQLQSPRFGVFASGHIVDNHKIESVPRANVVSIKNLSKGSSGFLYTVPEAVRIGLCEHNELAPGGILRQAMVFAAGDIGIYPDI